MRAQTKRVSAVVLISLIMSVLRTVIITYGMEQSRSGNDTYYLPDTIEVISYNTVAVIFSLLFIYTAIAFGRKKTVTLGRNLGAVPGASLVLAFSLIGAAAVYAASAVTSEDFESGVIDLLVFAATVFSAAKFLVSGLRYRKKYPSGNIDALTCLIPILFSILRLLGDFIRTSTAPMASSGAYHIISLIAVLLYFLSEGKSYVSKTAAPTFYICGYIALFFLLTYSFPNLVLHCFMFNFDYHAAYSVVDLGLVVYIASRLSSAKLIEKCEENK